MACTLIPSRFICARLENIFWRRYRTPALRYCQLLLPAYIYLNPVKDINNEKNILCITAYDLGFCLC